MTGPPAETRPSESVTLPAGRDLDVLVAERVMGWTVNHADGRHWHTVGPTGRERGILIGRYCCQDKYDGAFCPSTDIASAWEVVEKLNAADRWPIIQFGPSEGGDTTQWCVQLVNPADVEANAETAPLAICRAALAAVEHS